MRVLVAGGAGFIGSHFVRALLRDEYPWPAGADVVAFDALTYAGNLANLAEVADDPRFRFVRGDICSPADLDGVVPGADLVVNLAAESHVDRSIDSAAEFVRTNVLAAQTLFEACRRHGVPRVVHVSTDEVYGSIDEGAWREDAPLRPNSPYAASKAGGDLIARAYAVTHGLNVSVTRCSNNYGPYQYPEKIIPLFVTRLLDGRRVPLYGEGEQRRDWLWVGDHCRALALVAEKGERGEVYHVGGGRELSNRELTALLLAATGRDWSFVQHVVDPRGPGHDQRYCLDFGKLAALGYAPQKSFEDGLATTLAWFRDHRDWWQPLVPTAGTQ